MITEERKTYPTARDGSIASVRGHYSITTHAKQLLKYPKDWEDVTDLPTQLDVCRFMAKMYRDDASTMHAILYFMAEAPMTSYLGVHLLSLLKLVHPERCQNDLTACGYWKYLAPLIGPEVLGACDVQ